MPGVSADSDEAVLESWSVEQGARVASGQTIASVETEKATVDVESDVDAIVHTLLVAGGATVPVGDPIAILLGVDEPASAAEKLLADLGVGGTPAGAATSGGGDGASADTVEKELDAAVQSAPEEAAGPEGPAPSAASPKHVDTGAGDGAASNGGRQFTSPSARRLARELGVDITTLSGSGPKGRVVNADVQAAAQAAPAPAPAPAPAAPAVQPAPQAPAPAAAAAAPGRPCRRAGPRCRTAGCARSLRSGCRSPRPRRRTSTCACPRGWMRCSRCGRSSTRRAGSRSRSTT